MVGMKRIALGAFVILGCAAVFIAIRQDHPRPVLSKEVAEQGLVGDKDYGRGNYVEAEKQFVSLVEKLKSSKDPRDQDRVAGARMHIGYIRAKYNDFENDMSVFI